MMKNSVIPCRADLRIILGVALAATVLMPYTMAKATEPFCGLDAPLATTPHFLDDSRLRAGPTRWVWSTRIKQWQPEPFTNLYTFSSEAIRYSADTLRQRDGTYLGAPSNGIANYQNGSDATSSLVAFTIQGGLIYLPSEDIHNFQIISLPQADGCGSSETGIDALAIQAMGSSRFTQHFPEGVVFAGTSHHDTCSQKRNEVFALDSAFRIRWVFNEHATLRVGPLTGFAISAEKDLLVFTVDRINPDDDSLFAIDVTTSGLVWSTNLSRIQVPPLVHGNRVYSANLTGQITATALDDGHMIWTFKTPFPVVQPMSLHLVGGQVMLYVVDYLGWLRGIADRGDHAETTSWFRLPDGTPGSTTPDPAVRGTTRILAFADGQAIVGGDDGWLYAVNFLNGTIDGKVEVSDGNPVQHDLLARAPGLPGETNWSVIAKAGGTLARFCTSLPWSSRIYVDGFDGLAPTTLNPEGNVAAD